MIFNGKSLTTLFSNVTRFANSNLQQTRSKWVNKWMIRDVKRRKMAVEYADLRLRTVALKRNDILPVEIRDMASAEMNAMPLNSGLHRCNKRCVITSRGRGVVIRWRLSRIVFRHLADYNKLSGVQRAMW